MSIPHPDLLTALIPPRRQQDKDFAALDQSQLTRTLAKTATSTESEVLKYYYYINNVREEVHP